MLSWASSRSVRIPWEINKSQNANQDYTEVVRRLQDAGIAVAASFILGIDGQAQRSITALKDWLTEAQPRFLNLGVLTPMPNTVLYRQLQRDGRLLADGLALWKHLDKSTNTIKYELDAKEIDASFEDIQTHFFRPQVIAKTMLSHVVGKRQIVMPSIYLAAALQKRKGHCRTVAFPPRKNASTPSGEHAERSPLKLKLLTWNINQWPVLGAGKSCRQDLERVREAIGEFDVVCLQECWSADSQELRWAFPFHYFDHMLPRTGLGSGLLILSKHPIRAWYHLPYKARAFPDSLSNKSATMVTIEAQGGHQVDVINTHLQAWGKPKIRQLQLEELVRFIAQRRQSPVGVVVGDFNLTRGSGALDPFKKACVTSRAQWRTQPVPVAFSMARG